MRTGVKLIPKRRLANIEALIKHTAESGETMYGRSRYAYAAGIRTANLLFSQGETTAFYLKDWTADNYENLKLGTLFPGVVEGIGDAASIQASNTDGRYLSLKARDTGVGEVEVARLQGQAEPRLKYVLPLNLGSDTELTISSGVITIGVGSGAACYRIDGEGDAADDLGGISGGVDGDIIILRAENAARAIVVKHEQAGTPPTGNISLDGSADKTLDDPLDRLVLMFDADISAWCQLAFSSN